MLKRKIISELVKWKQESSNKALLIKGARQIGKTTIVRQFAMAHYKNMVEINFEQMPMAKQAPQTWIWACTCWWKPRFPKWSPAPAIPSFSACP